MKLWKKLTSLLMAAAMLMSMVVVPASAAGTFADADQITYNEEVAITAGLGLFAGADGKFMPKDTVTRAQMATIIVKMLHGSDANADSFKGISGGFTDTANFEGGWAEGYINWCSSLGIVKGYGDGTFKPGNKVTAAEAVTMILNALKIDAGEGTWPVTVMAKAEEVKFFEDLNTKPASDKALSREELAVVSLAGLEYSPEGKTGYMYDGKVFDTYFDALLVAGDASKITPAANDTLATKVFELKTAEGFIVANQDSGADYTELNGERVFDIKSSLDQIGHYVTVYYKEAYESEEEPGVTYAIHDETVTVKVDEAIDSAKLYKEAFGKSYNKNTDIVMIDGEYNVSDVPGSIAGYEGGAKAPAGTYFIYKNNIVSYMEPVAKYASYVSAINTYEGEEGMLINKATADGSYIPNTEGDDRIVGERGIVEGDCVLYTKVQDVYFLGKVLPVVGSVTRMTTDEDGKTVITFNGEQYTAFDGETAGVTSKLNTDVNEMIFDETYELYVTEDNEFIGFVSTGSINLDDIVYVVGSGAVPSKDNYGKQIISTVARCVDMEGVEKRIVVGITKDGETLGTDVLPASGFYSVTDSKDKDAKKEDIKVLTPVPNSYDGKNVFAVTSSGEDNAFHSNGFRHMKTSDGKQTHGKAGSKYIVIDGDMTSQALDIDVLNELVFFEGTKERRFDLLVSRAASGKTNLVEVMIITGMSATEVASGSGAPIYITEEQIKAGGRTADGHAYEVYNAEDGTTVQIVVDEENAIAAGETGFYEMLLDDDGLAIITKMSHNAKITDAFVRQNQGLLGLFSGRDLQSHNTSYTMVYNSSTAVKVVDVRSEDQIKTEKTARITSTAQLFELVEGEEGIVVVGDLYVTQTSGGDPKVRCIYVTSITHNTPGLQSIVYAFDNPGTSGQNVPMALVSNDKGTAAGQMIDVTYQSTIDAKSEGFYMYCVDADGEPTLKYLPVGSTAKGYPGTMGQHNLVTAVDVEGATITTEDYHGGCTVGCRDQNEAVRGELTISQDTVIYDADGKEITLEKLAALAQGGQMIINYYCSDAVFHGDTPTDNSPEAIFVVENVEPGIEIHRHGCSNEHVGSGEWAPLSAALANFTVNASNITVPAGRYYLDKDITLEKYLYLSGDVALCLNGHTLSSKANDAYIISFSKQCTLDICDCSEHGAGIIGGAGWQSTLGSTNAAIIIRANGTVNMYGGAISGITSTQAIFVHSGGTLNMYGGTITDNTTKTNGAVYVNKNATFNMYGGEIKGNEIPMGKTQVTKADDSAIVNIDGGTVTENVPPAPAAYTHPATCAHGHADWSGLTWTKLDEVVASTGKTTLTTGNYYLEDDVTLVDGYLSIPKESQINLCLNGNEIIGANGKGYIICFDGNGSQLNICDSSANQTGKIGNGWSSTTGNRVYSVIRMGSTGMTGNELNMYAGSITGATSGSTVYVQKGNTFKMHGGAIVGNTVISTGTVVYAMPDCTVQISGGVIANNTVNNGKDMIFDDSKPENVTITGGKFDFSPKSDYVDSASYQIVTDAEYGYAVTAK